MRTRTKALIGGVALLIIAAAATVVLRAERDAPLAELEVARQSVNVERSGGGAPAAGEELAIGDRITTDAQGLGTVNWFDGSLTRLGGDADFVVQELTSASGGRQIVGQLNFGESWHRVQEATGSGSRFEVHTSNAVASVRGTAFLVRCIPNCRYGVAEGQVQVLTEDGESVIVDGGEQVEEDENGDLGDIEPLDLDDPWLQMNQELDSELGGGGDPTDPESESEGAGDGDGDGDATSSTTAPPTTAAPSTTSPPTSSAPFTPRSGADNDDEGDPVPESTTSTGTIPADPPPPTPPPTIPPDPPSSPTTAAPSTSTPPTSPPPTSDPPPTAPDRTTSSTNSTTSTTAPTTTTTTAPTTTTTPPTTAPPTTSAPSPPSGGGGGSPPTTSAPTTTSTTEAPPDTGSISGTVSEPDTTTDTTAGLASVVAAGTAFACPHGATGDTVCFGEVIVDGAFTISDVPPGNYDVFATPPEGRSDLAASDSVLVELTEGEHEEGVALTYNLAPTFELSGTVREAGVEGPFVEGASVVVFPSGCDCSGTETTTNSDGFYSFFLTPGDYFVEVSKDGFEPASANITIVDADVQNDFELSALPTVGSISGKVTDSDGATVQGAAVFACPTTLDAGCTEEASNADGNYVIAELPFDTYAVHAEPGTNTHLSSSPDRSAEITATNPDAQGIDLVMPPAEVAVCIICGEVAASSESHSTLKLPAAAPRPDTGASPKREVAAGRAREAPAEVPAAVRSVAPRPAPAAKPDAPAVEPKLAPAAERLAPPPRRSDFGTPPPEPRELRVAVERPPPDPEPPPSETVVAAEAAPSPP